MSVRDDRVPLLLRLSVRLLPAHVREEVLGDLLELWRADAAFRAQVDATYRDVERRLSAEPAVSGVTFAGRPPGAYHPRHLFEVEGVPLPSGSTLERQAQTASVGVNFFDALGASIASGRDFDAGDLAEGGRAVIVNRSFVEWFVRDRNPIGRRIRYLCTGENCSAPAAEPGPWHEIVGVVDDVRLTISADLPHNAGLYHPVAPGEAPELNLLVQVRGNRTTSRRGCARSSPTSTPRCGSTPSGRSTKSTGTCC